MPNHPFTQPVRDEIRELIHDAIIEPDFARRLALLTTADHWIAVLEKRAGASSWAEADVA